MKRGWTAFSWNTSEFLFYPGFKRYSFPKTLKEVRVPVFLYFFLYFYSCIIYLLVFMFCIFLSSSYLIVIFNHFSVLFCYFSLVDCFCPSFVCYYFTWVFKYPVSQVLSDHCSFICPCLGFHDLPPCCLLCASILLLHPSSFSGLNRERLTDTFWFVCLSSLNMLKTT